MWCHKSSKQRCSRSQSSHNLNNLEPKAALMEASRTTVLLALLNEGSFARVLVSLKRFSGSPNLFSFFFYIKYIFLSLIKLQRSLITWIRNRQERQKKWNSDFVPLLNWWKNKQKKNTDTEKANSVCHTDGDVVNTSQLRQEAAPTQRSRGAVISESQIRTRTPGIYRLVSSKRTEQTEFPHCCLSEPQRFSQPKSLRRNSANKRGKNDFMATN